jgi:hypothetical protein
MAILMELLGIPKVGRTPRPRRTPRSGCPEYKQNAEEGVVRGRRTTPDIAANPKSHRMGANILSLRVSGMLFALIRH